MYVHIFKNGKRIDTGLYFNRTLNHIQMCDSIGINECFAWRKHDIREVEYMYEGQHAEKWSRDLYTDTINYAAKAHGNQQVPYRNYSYLAHVASVAQEIMALRNGEFDFDNAVQVALLHDVLEDTEVIYEKLCADIGVKIAVSVFALTKDSMLPKEERMKDSIHRIKKAPVEAAMVKMADRIVNLQKPPTEWSLEKRRAYKEEAEYILGELCFANGELADRLERKILEYGLWYTKE